MSHPSRGWPALVAGLLSLAVAGPAPAEFFAGPDLVPSSGGPGDVVLAEMSRDGALDLVVTATRAGQILIHKGRGDGTYRPPTPVAVGGSPGALDVGDIDRNGQTDVVWLDESSGDVGILFQVGSDPVIYVPEVYRGEDEPQSLEVVDLDGDGWEDIVVAAHGADLVSVYTNAGGVLLPPVLHDVGDGPAVVREIWVPSRAERRFVLVQRGALASNVGIYDAAFEPLQLLSVNEPAGVSSLDWDGNADPDLALTSTNGRAHVYTAQSSGQFTSSVSWDVPRGASQIQAMPDVAGEKALLVLEPSRNRIAVYTGPATGPVRARKGYFLGVEVERFRWGDIDLDGNSEVLVPLADEDNVLILRRQGLELGGFVSTLTGGLPRRLGVAPSAGALPARLGSLCPGSGEIWIYDVAGGEMALSHVLPVPAASRTFRWGRIDGDDLIDLAVLDEAAGVRVFLAEGTGFSAPIAVPASGAFRDVDLVRWGSDPNPDLVLADANAAAIRVFSGDGNGGFTETGSIGTQDVPRRVSAVDLDRDGHGDLVSLGDNGTLAILYGGPDGLDEESIFTVGPEPRGLAFDDFNRDGIVDIAVGNAGDGTFSVLASVIARIYGFSTQDQITPDGSQTVVSLDANGDDDPDLVFCSPSSRSVSLHLNSGGGLFVLPVRIRCSSLPLDMAVLDLNADGTSDLVVADTVGDALVTLLGESTGSKVPPDEDPSPVPGPVAAADGLWLEPPHPNPSSGAVRLRLRSSRAGDPAVRIYDLRGRLVRRLGVEPEGGGWYDATWNGRDQGGRAVARGRYLVELSVGSERRTRSLVLR